NVVALRDQEREVAAVVDGLKGELQLAKGRKASLDALQQAAQTTHDETINALLKDSGLEETDRLATSISVEPGWETAVETAMGACLQAICTDKEVASLHALQSLSSGEIAV